MSSSSSSSSDVTFESFVPSAAAFTMSTLMSASSASVPVTPKPTVRASGSSTMSCGASTVTPPTRGLLPVQHDLTTPRARARAARLRANEAAERREDLAALITTPAQWALLRRSFAGVKTEFADLDGMSWNAFVSMPVPVSTPGPGRRSSIRGSKSASAPTLGLDDSTVRPRFKRKRPLSLSVLGWGQGVTTSKTRSMT